MSDFTAKMLLPRSPGRAYSIPQTTYLGEREEMGKGNGGSGVRRGRKENLCSSDFFLRT